MYELAFKPSIGPYGSHDASVAIFRNGKLVLAVEEERFTREKHAYNSFPTNGIHTCLDECGIELSDVSRIILPYNPKLRLKTAPTKLKNILTSGSIHGRIFRSMNFIRKSWEWQFNPTAGVEQRLREEFGDPLPDITLREHHACHAASAFHLSPFDSAIGLTIDSQGEYDSTVIWKCSNIGLERIKTYRDPNSLGMFYGIFTEFLGFRKHNGEAKVMGLAPYGSENISIENKIRNKITTGANYDVTNLTKIGARVDVLEEMFDRQPSTQTKTYTDWEKDLAYTVQKITEEIVVDIAEKYSDKYDEKNIVLAGGVGLNCKMNKKVMEIPNINLFVQPVAHDAGLSLGAGVIDQLPKNVEPQHHIYYGTDFTNGEILNTLEDNKIPYVEPENIEKAVAQKIADGKIVARFKGPMEMGPRALGNRSILADPRTKKSRDRVNRYVKHREEWRPFAPSILESAIDRYLVNGEKSPYMIKTFKTKKEVRHEIEAVLHPGDFTTRPQTVSKKYNPEYYELISEFEGITGVPVVLNTSFNDHAEPIVNTPTEALKDFYGMGLDCLALGDYLIEK